ncbi:MAG: DUF302 domain-containing protein [Proteobacteria bacterium]|nr:DUF302 domain-containing protein [Pseudomonadota bacterium]
MDHDVAVERVTASLKEQGFGVLTTIDMESTLQAKLGVDLGRRYTILGACNPPMAHAAVQAEPAIGLLLPCNVVVSEEPDGGTVVSAIHPGKMFMVVDNPDLAPVATEVERRLTAALESLPTA